MEDMTDGNPIGDGDIKSSLRIRFEEGIVKAKEILEQNNGIWPKDLNKRGLSNAAICGLIEVQDTLLAKPRHHGTREWLSKEVDKLKKYEIRGKKEVRKTYTSKVAELQAQIKELRDDIVIFKIDTADALNRAYEAEKNALKATEEAARLRAENAELRRKAGEKPSNVLPIP